MKQIWAQQFSSTLIVAIFHSDTNMYQTEEIHFLQNINNHLTDTHFKVSVLLLNLHIPHRC